MNSASSPVRLSSASVESDTVALTFLRTYSTSICEPTFRSATIFATG